MTSESITQVEKVLRYIKDEIDVGRLLPGERLLAERRLSEKLNVSRPHVRAALQKLKFYGIVETRPNSGTYIVQEKLQVLDRMFTDVLQLDQYDFASLVHVRILLEKEAAMLCAQNHNEEDLQEIEAALIAFEQGYQTDNRVALDFAFHQSIVKASHNPVLGSLLTVITPDVLRYYQKFGVCDVLAPDLIKQHRDLFDKIKKRDTLGAAEQLQIHLKNLKDFADKNHERSHFLTT